MSRRHSDYCYRNADDTVRVRIFRGLAGRWDFDTVRCGGEIINHASKAATNYATKAEAKNRAIEEIGALTSIQVESLTDGWQRPSTKS